MVCALNKERVFYVVKGNNDNYIENIKVFRSILNFI